MVMRRPLRPIGGKKSRMRACSFASHCAAPTSWPSRARLVTPYSAIPHGTIPSKCDRSGSRLTEKPCIVTQRRTRTPIAPIFASRPSISLRPDADPPCRAPAFDAEIGQRIDHPAFHRMDETAHVARMASQVEQRITDPLPRPVIGVAAAAPRLHHIETRIEQFTARRAGSGSINRRMFQQTRSICRAVPPQSRGCAAPAWPAHRDRERARLRSPFHIRERGRQRRVRISHVGGWVHHIHCVARPRSVIKCRLGRHWVEFPGG